jgi:acetyl-CoA carboxylase biotin carboxyl carrier protein
MGRLDLDLVRHALSKAREHGFVEVELDSGEDHFHAKLTSQKPAPVIAHPVAEAEPVENANQSVIKSPAVGYFQEASVPVAVGQTIAKGDLIGSIVALGIANDVESNWSGKVTDIFVKPEQAVEYGQPLLAVEP